MTLPSHDLAKVPERRDVDARVFQEEILPANRPVVLRGLVRDWPVVQHGQVSAQGACEYLMRFYEGRVVPLLQQGMPYREIHELTQVSVTTIGRVARTLERGTGGYALASRSSVPAPSTRETP